MIWMIRKVEKVSVFWKGLQCQPKLSPFSLNWV